jgi:hypothetical protein
VAKRKKIPSLHFPGIEPRWCGPYPSLYSDSATAAPFLTTVFHLFNDLNINNYFTLLIKTRKDCRNVHHPMMTFREVEQISKICRLRQYLC